MEAWGAEALRAGRNEIAEEAFLEALAHDPGGVRAAMGLQVLCERLGRTEEARRYADLAHRTWCKADPEDFAAEIAMLRNDNIAARAQRKRSETGGPILNR